jgi:hypothetical protein
VLSGEATNTNFIVFALTRPGLKPTIYHTQGEYANYYTTDAVQVEGYSKNTTYNIYSSGCAVRFEHYGTIADFVG